MFNEPFKTNYHSHSKRCGHAEGEDEEFVLSAIKNGYEIYGFSDHVMLPKREQKGMRGSYEKDAEDYFASIRSLARKYQNEIEIFLAFEAEWYYGHYSRYYDDLLRSGTVDYLIIGQHCFIDEETDKIVFYGQLKDQKEATIKYKNDLIAGIESGNFVYVAHPDLFMQWYPSWDLFTKGIALEIIKAAKKQGTLLELNMGPARWGERKGLGDDFKVAYPNEEFWHLVSEEKADCIVGIDNHRPYELSNTPYDWMRSFIERHDLKPIERLSLPFKKK